MAEEKREVVDGVVDRPGLRSSFAILAHAKRKVKADGEEKGEKEKLDGEDGAGEEAVGVDGSERRDVSPAPRIRAVAFVVASSGAAALIRIDEFRP